jgi:hypothetical protein
VRVLEKRSRSGTESGCSPFIHRVYGSDGHSRVERMVSPRLICKSQESSITRNSAFWSWEEGVPPPCGSGPAARDGGTTTTVARAPSAAAYCRLHQWWANRSHIRSPPFPSAGQWRLQRDRASCACPARMRSFGCRSPRCHSQYVNEAQLAPLSRVCAKYTFHDALLVLLLLMVP